MRKVNLLIVLVLLSAMLNACSGGSSSPTQTSSLQVLATESFLQDIAQNVAGDRIKIETLVPFDVDPHAFEPRPQDITKITASQVLIVNGLGYETWLKKTLENISGQQLLVVATSGLAPNLDPSGEHPDGDPHMWMNPLNVIKYTENIRDGLSRADPVGRDIYAKNADAYIAKLKDLDQWVKTELNQLSVEKRLLVTNHDALGYFARAYDFKVVGAVIPGITDAAAPSAQEMAGLVDVIKTSGASAIFLDMGENETLARQIAAETGIKVVSDLYVESTSAPGGPAPTYIDMLKHDVLEIISVLK